MKNLFLAPIISCFAAIYAYVCGSYSREVFGISIFAITVFVAFLIQVLAFIPAYLLNTEKFYDLTGSITFLTIIAITIVTNENISTKQIIVSFVVLAWAFRLGSFLFLRVLKVG
jgi:steroid 5-alpha reductase family enzyme